MADDYPGSIELGHYVLGLRDSVLQEVAENASGSPVSSVKPVVLSRDWPEYGVCGDKCIISLSFESVDQLIGDVTIFVKRQSGLGGFKETPHYEYLNKTQLPVPILYGSLLDDQQMEVLLLEDVQPNTDGDRLLDNPDNLSAFLALAARINALQPEGDYGSSLYYFAMDRGIDRGTQAIEAIWSAAASGQLGADVMTLCSRTRRDALLSLAEFLGRNVPKLERGYTHNEYVPEQIGRRQDTGEMMVFDLRTTGLGPRFVDVAPWLGVPNRVQNRGHTTTELADHYLQQYLGAGGRPVSIETLMSETRMLWQASTISGLDRAYDYALTGNANPEDKDKGRETFQDRLFGDLTQLLETLPDR